MGPTRAALSCLANLSRCNKTPYAAQTQAALPANVDAIKLILINSQRMQQFQHKRKTKRKKWNSS